MVVLYTVSCLIQHSPNNVSEYPKMCKKIGECFTMVTNFGKVSKEISASSPIEVSLDDDGSLESHEKEGDQPCDCVLCVSMRPWSGHKETERIKKVNENHLPQVPDFRDSLDAAEESVA